MASCRGISSITKSLANGFIRYVYIPICHSNLTPSKIAKDLSHLEKKPSEEMTFVFEIKSTKAIDLTNTVSKIVRYGRIVEEAINPTRLNCYLDVSFIKPEEKR